MSALKFVIFGQFRIYSSDGDDLTPRSSKSQALLLLLIRSPHALRGRRWLQDKLWSDRAPEQGANSLRQELSQIRRTFGGYSNILGADRQNVWLNLKEVVVDQTSNGDLVEGLDARDGEFEYWLSCERSRVADEIAKDEVGQSSAIGSSKFLRPKRRIFVETEMSGDHKQEESSELT